VTIHRYPPNLGRTASCITRDLPELAEAGERFLAGERYVGLAELELKRDARDGSYRLFEVNTRSWNYNSLAPASGVDLVHLAYLDATGQPLPEARARPCPGRIWVNSELEMGFLWKSLREGRLHLPPWGLLSPRTAHARLCWSDPQPAVREVIYRLGRLVRPGAPR
jgi:predicted ATP-grasp superfamily ATP-dependent carboligase